MTEGYTTVQTQDGRSLEVLTGGDPDGFPLLYHGGTPSAAVPYERLDRAAREAGLRLITYSRPGYGASTAYPREEPRVVDDVDDCVVILEASGVERFITVGWSGGGPRALACAALLPERCLAAASIAGVGPHDGAGLDWKAGMAEEIVADYTAAETSRDAYAAYLEGALMPMMQASADDIEEAMGGLLDRGFTEWLTETFHRAGDQRTAGALEDGLALVRPWGFDLASITVPTLVYQGRQDALLPFAHGEWLASHVPGTEAHLSDEDDHLTWMITGMPGILADLKRRAGH